MNGHTNTLRVSNGAAEVVAGHVRAWGRVGVESGGFLIAARRDPDLVVDVALAGHAGILRRRYQFGVSGAAFEQLDAWCEDRNAIIAAQFHSHERGAFLSDIDESSGYRIEGFVSIVVPRFEQPSSDVSKWGWWRFTAGQWVRIDSPSPTTGEVTSIAFDEDGTR